jgi:hypothetical protein
MEGKMKNNWTSKFLLSIMVTAFFLMNSSLPASANSQHKGTLRATFLSLIPLKDVNLGDKFEILGSILDSSGNPIENEHIVINVNGSYLGQAKSDPTGIFMLKVNKKLDAGKYIIQASFKGSRFFFGSDYSIPLQINTANIIVQTVPALSGVPLRMNGMELLSDDKGKATFEFTKPGTYRLQVLIDKYKNSSVRIEFGRWGEEDYEAYRDIKVPSDEVIQVGLNVFHQVSQKFVDLSGFPVSPDRITEYTIKSAQGDVFTYTNNQSGWIPSSRIARRITGLEETKLLYSTVSVTVDGSNVVNQSQQKFYASPNGTWQISLLLYSLQIHARDGLFASPVGKNVELQFPDGKIVKYPLDASGNAQIHSLARGLYTFKIDGVNGLTNPTPVALSRDQVVDIKAITFLDIGIVGFLGLILVFGLLIYGRPWLLSPTKQKNLKLRLDNQWSSIHEN